MNWLTNVVRPKIRNMLRRETPENLWIKCPDSGQLVFYKDVEANQFVIPGSNYHMRMGAVARLKSIFDNETWFDVALPEVAADPLRFRDEKRYADRVKDARARTGLNDAIKIGYGKLEGALSASGILKGWRASGQASKIRSRVSRVADVWDLAAAGNGEARRILKQRAMILTDVIVDMALILNPNLILLGGEVGNHAVLLREVKGLLEGSEFAVVRVELGALGRSAVLRGAASIALEPTILRLLRTTRRGSRGLMAR